MRKQQAGIVPVCPFHEQKSGVLIKFIDSQSLSVKSNDRFFMFKCRHSGLSKLYTVLFKSKS